MRRNLVIVRAGDASLHPRWVEGATKRTWDLLVSYYGHDADVFRDCDCLRVDTPGPKCPGLAELFRRERKRISGYDYVLVADDDLDWGTDDINRLFEICAKHGLELAQPSLTADSYFAHMIAVHNPLFQLRYTTFVEVMATCMSQSAWRATRHTFSESVSCFGIDYAWPRLVRSGGIAIVDAVEVRHTQPMGGPNVEASRRQGIVPEAEAEEVMKTYGISSRCFRVERGITARRGIEVKAKFSLVILYALGLALGARRMKMGWRAFPRALASAVWQQIRPNASPRTFVRPRHGDSGRK